MSTQALTRLIKSLETQIEATNDPQLKADLSRQLTKALTKPKRRGRPRKAAEGVVVAPKKTRALREIYPQYESMTDGSLVVHHLISEVEKKRKAGELKTDAERAVFINELFSKLTDHEKTAYQGYDWAI